MSSEERLLRLADLNLAESARAHARWLPPTQIEETESMLLTAAGTRFPAGPFNSLLALGPGPRDPDALLEHARSWFNARGRGFTVYVRSHADAALASACERAGIARMADQPGMALTERVAAATLGPSQHVQVIERAEQASGFVDICAAAYESVGLPIAVTRKVLSQPDNWLRPDWQTHVLYDSQRPVAAAMLCFSHGIAGVYWVGTLPDARGRGHASAIMRSVSNAAFDAGAQAVVLQATPFGEPVYRKLGYREITRYPWYLALPPK